MIPRLYFSSSAKVWDDIQWVYGIEEAGYDGWEIVADGNYRLEKPEVLEKIKEIIASTRLGVTGTTHPMAILTLRPSTILSGESPSGRSRSVLPVRRNSPTGLPSIPVTCPPQVNFCPRRSGNSRKRPCAKLADMPLSTGARMS